MSYPHDGESLGDPHSVEIRALNPQFERTVHLPDAEPFSVEVRKVLGSIALESKVVVRRITSLGKKFFRTDS